MTHCRTHFGMFFFAWSLDELVADQDGSLDEAEPSEKVEYLDAEYADNGEAFAVFHFYYRSLRKSRYKE